MITQLVAQSYEWFLDDHDYYSVRVSQELRHSFIFVCISLGSKVVKSDRVLLREKGLEVQEDEIKMRVSPIHPSHTIVSVPRTTFMVFLSNDLPCKSWLLMVSKATNMLSRCGKCVQ